jgi:hypothetical protein
MHGYEYSVLGEYVNNRTKISICHNSCENTWDVTPSNFLKGRCCPKCSMSSGESRIERYLISKNIKYKRQYSLRNCRGLNFYKLRFDFCIYNEDNSIFLLIEYQGRQHYRPVDFFGGIDAYHYTCCHDIYKRYYCEKRFIPLLEIKYTDFNNIENILNKELEIL